MTAIQMIRLLAPEFANETDEMLNQWVEMFAPLISKKVFGKLYNQALALLIAHKLKLAGFGSNEYGSVAEAMRLSSVSEGDSTISFNAAQSPTIDADAEYLLTSYGVQFNDIKHRVMVHVHCGGEG